MHYFSLLSISYYCIICMSIFPNWSIGLVEVESILTSCSNQCHDSPCICKPKHFISMSQEFYRFYIIRISLYM